jgi:hypothetical protein
MPLHDWTRVDSGLFHDFHQSWCVHIKDALNSGVLSPDYLALVEQHIRGPIADVLTLQLPRGKRKGKAKDDGGGVATAPATTPASRVVRRKENAIYARRASRVTVRHRHGDVVAVIEIVSPGNKATAAECRAFVTKSADLMAQGVNLLLVDLFPPGKHDPQRLHQAIWDEFASDDDDDPPADLPADKPLTVVGYDAGPVKVAYIEPLAVGDPLPDMPVFLQPEVWVPVPLETTYQTTWRLFPDALKELLEVPPEQS